MSSLPTVVSAFDATLAGLLHAVSAHQVTFHIVICSLVRKERGKESGLCQCRAAALAGLLFAFRRQNRQRVGMKDATSSGSSIESHKRLPSLDGEVDLSEFVFCRNADGSEVCLGEGSFGKARVPASQAVRKCSHESTCMCHAGPAKRKPN